ncbi:MAG: AAA family ATPase [Anaerolineaceae bacterium]|nr:AAA family ATPase [Anaerolineaceae bacterium]
MVSYGRCEPEQDASALKLDVLRGWLETEWMAERTGQELIALAITYSVIDLSVLAKYVPDFALAQDFRFTGITPVECSVVMRLNDLNDTGDLTHQMGAHIYRFVSGDKTVDVMVVATYYTDEIYCHRTICLAAVPKDFLPVWHTFTKECVRLDNALEPDEKVIIVGGKENSFVPKVDWDEIVLPAKLKTELLDDVSSFFTKGVDVYRRLNLRPFRKLLLAGVPGTGKTMICSALAKWAISNHYPVIYISSAYRKQGEASGATFEKIEYALSIAASSALPTLILLEELDAYLHEEEKALVLNVLDGNESQVNDKGTLLIATTNYPEAIDERVLKRPGRLDRIFIIPEARTTVDTEQMLRQYLGVLWQDEHKKLIPALVGYPGAFIREVAVHALTQCAYDDLNELSYDLLQRSFNGLKAQLDARDDFLKQRSSNGMQFGAPVLVN